MIPSERNDVETKQLLRQLVCGGSNSGILHGVELLEIVSLQYYLPARHIVKHIEWVQENAGILDRSSFTACIPLPDQILCAVELTSDSQELQCASSLSEREVLRRAGILVRSRAGTYDPKRPLAWTARGLRRTVALYSLRGFYDNQ